MSRKSVNDNGKMRTLLNILDIDYKPNNRGKLIVDITKSELKALHQLFKEFEGELCASN